MARARKAKVRMVMLVRPLPYQQAKVGKQRRGVYVYCRTPECKGRVFLGPQPLPDKCKVCHFCDVPFALPRVGKGGGVGPSRVPAKEPTSPGIPTTAITTAYDKLIAGGMLAEQASAVLHDLGHVVPKPSAPKQPTDAYARISKLNGESSSMQNTIDQKKKRHEKSVQN